MGNMVQYMIDYPALYQSADASSLTGQRRFLNATRVRLAGLVIAAAGGAFTASIGAVDVFGVLALVGFAGAIAAEAYILLTKPDRVWYEGRAAAESVKTLAWRYSVGGEPFPASLNEGVAVDLFLARLGEILQDLKDLNLTPTLTANVQITAEMRRLRIGGFNDRRAAYGSARIEDQRSWYAAKATWNEVRAQRWSIAVVGFEIFGLAAGGVKAFTAVDVDLLGLAAAVAAVFTAWRHAKQYETLNHAYFVASQELASIASQVERHRDDDNWAQFVQEAEDAISREHTLWRASRGVQVRN